MSFVFGPSIRRKSAFKMVFLGSGFTAGTSVTVEQLSTRLIRHGTFTDVQATHAVASFAAIVNQDEKEDENKDGSVPVGTLDDDILEITVTVGNTIWVGPGVVSP